MSLKMSKKVPRMGLKWPKMGQNGPILGVLGAFSGNLGLLDVILDRYVAAGTSHAHKWGF